MAKQTICAGYVAFNGHVFSAHEAKIYNLASMRGGENPSEADKNNAHRLFSNIIYAPEKAPERRAAAHPGFYA